MEQRAILQVLSPYMTLNNLFPLFRSQPSHLCNGSIELDHLQPAQSEGRIERNKAMPEEFRVGIIFEGVEMWFKECGTWNQLTWV